MKTAHADLALALALLRGECSPAKVLRTRLERVGGALPWAAERAHFEPSAERQLLQAGLLNSLWTWIRQQRADTAANGWRDLAAGVIVAASILGVVLPELDVVMGTEGVSDLAAGRRPPEVFAVLYPNGPSRVCIRFDADGAGGSSSTAQVDWSPPPTWWREGRPSFVLEHAFDGRSCEAAFVAKWAASLWPAHLRSLGPLGVIGEVARDGRIRAVQQLRSKVQAFQRRFPRHLCFVPAGDLSAALFAPAHSAGETIDLANIVPVASVEDLLFKLGIPAEALPDNLAWEAVGTRSGVVADWAGRPVAIEDAADLPIGYRSTSHQPPPLPKRRYRRLEEREDEEDEPLSLKVVVQKMMAEAIKHPNRHAGGTVTGLPGGGKSWLLRQMHHRLSAGTLRQFGPSLLVNARRVTAERSLHDLIRDELRAVDSDARLDGSRATLWLLIDGLDELEPAMRTQIVQDLREWSGPFFVATRSLPEALPGSVSVEMLPLSEKQSSALLAALGRPIEDSPKQTKEEERQKKWSPRHDPAVSERFAAQAEPERATESKSPHEQLRSTPFGCALLASCEAGQVTSTSREMLMRLVVRQSVSRAERHRPEPELRRALRWFDDIGVRFVGAAAWNMLRERRARMLNRDVAYALDHVPEGLKLSVEFDRAAQHIGFLQIVDANVWEFTHKAFAEYCAAEYLQHQMTRDPDALQELLACIGEPGADEVALYLALLLKTPEVLLNAIADNGRHPLASLALVCRMLAEVGGASTSLVVRVLNRRLRLISWFAHPDHVLPFGGNGPHDVWSLLRERSEALRPHWRELTEGCHPQTLAWLRGDDWGDRRGVEFDRKMAERSPFGVEFGGDDVHTLARARRAIAEDVHYLLQFDVPGKALALMTHVPAMLENCAVSDRTRFRRPLVRVLDSKDPLVKSGARAAWGVAARPRDLVQRVSWLGDRDLPGRLAGAILHAVSNEGSAELEMEALLWYSLGRLRNPEQLLCQKIRGLLATGELETAWSLGWSHGLLGAADHFVSGPIGPRELSPLDTLYSGFLDDSEPFARLQSMISWFVGLEGDRDTPEADRQEVQEPVAEAAVRAIHDPLPSLRFAGADVLLFGLARPDLISLPDLWQSGSAVEQLQWMALADRRGHHTPFGQDLAMIVRCLPNAGVSLLDPPRFACAFLRRRLTLLWQECLRALLRRCRTPGRQATAVTALVSCGSLEEARPVLEDLLSDGALRELARSDQEDVKRWASGEKARRKWNRQPAHLRVPRRAKNTASRRISEQQREEPPSLPDQASIHAAAERLGVPRDDVTSLRFNQSPEYREEGREAAPIGPVERLIIETLGSFRRESARGATGRGALDAAMESIATCAGSKETRAFDMEAVATMVRRGGREDALTVARHLLGVRHVARQGAAALNRLPAISWLLRSVGSIDVARRWGTLPEHALLLLPQACLDTLVDTPWDWGHYRSGRHESSEVVEQIIRRGAEREQVRRVFLRAALWGTEYWADSDRELKSLGGARSSDLPILLDALRECPQSPSALAYLNQVGVGDGEICELWALKNVPWWGVPSSHEHEKHPAVGDETG